MRTVSISTIRSLSGFGSHLGDDDQELGIRLLCQVERKRREEREEEAEKSLEKGRRR